MPLTTQSMIIAATCNGAENATKVTHTVHQATGEAFERVQVHSIDTGVADVAESMAYP